MGGATEVTPIVVEPVDDPGRAEPLLFEGNPVPVPGARPASASGVEAKATGPVPDPRVTYPAPEPHSSG